MAVAPPGCGPAHTAAAIPSKPSATKLSSSTWRPISRSQGKTTGTGSACRPTWRVSSATTSNAASSPTVLRGPDARTGRPHQGRFHTAQLNRQRQSLEREPRAVSAVLHILLRVIEAHLRRSSDASSQARFGAVRFIHRFGASLNRHAHDDANFWLRLLRADRIFAPANLRNHPLEQRGMILPHCIQCRAGIALRLESDARH